MIDALLFATNAVAFALAWAFLIFYTTRFRWEADRFGRFIVVGAAALTLLCSNGLLHRLDTALKHVHLHTELDLLSTGCYVAVAVVFAAALAVLRRDRR